MPQGHFAPNHTKFWKGDILPQLQNSGGHFAPTFFCIFLWHISGISWAYLEHILSISGAYLGHILSISWAYLEHIIGNLGDISGISCMHIAWARGKGWASKAHRLSAKGAKHERQRREGGRKKKQALDHPPLFNSQIFFLCSFLFSFFKSFHYCQIDRLFQMDHGAISPS